KLMAVRYRKANRQERSRLLSEMQAVTKQHRKHLIRLLNGKSLERKKRQTPRSRTYGGDVEHVILLVWESLDSICAQRLTPALLRTAQHLARFGEVSLTPQLEEQLQEIGVSTVQRLLRKHRASKGRLPRKGPERANQVTKGVPMRRIPWDTSEPGHARDGCGASWRGECLRGVWLHLAVD